MKKIIKSKKVLFSLAIAACVTALSLQVVSPFMNAVSDLTAFASETVKTSEKTVTEEEKKFDEKNAPESKGIKYENETITAPEVVGWKFAGWYDQKVEYHFWGSKTLIYSSDDNDQLYPEKDWDSAIEIKEYKSVYEDEGKDDYRGLFFTWLSKSKGSKVEVGSMQEGTEYYPRYTPETVRIDWIVKFKEGTTEVKELVKTDEGSFYRYLGQGMGRSYRQFGAPVGDVWTQDDIGLRACGRTLEGWRVTTESSNLNTVEAEYKQNKTMWCSDPLESKILKEEDGKDGLTKYQWRVSIQAAFKEETYTPDPKDSGSLVNSQAYMDGPVLEGEHVCSPVQIVLKNATCTEPGIRHHYLCSCGKTYQNPECTIELSKEDLYVAPHHTLVKISGKKATCTAAGEGDYYMCSVCYAMFADAEGTIPYTGETVPAKGHTWSNTYSYNNNGHYRTCTSCGAIDETEGHTWTENFTDNNGNHAKRCTVCGALKTEAHTWSNEYTTTASGHTTTCTVCGASKTESHTWNASSATVDHDKHCTVCNYVAQAKVEKPVEAPKPQPKPPVQSAPQAQPEPEAHRHSVTYVPEVSPTCTSDGTRGYYICECGEMFADSLCSEKLSKSDLVVKATGHELTLMEGFEPTCTEKGSKTYYECTHCGARFTDSSCKFRAGETEIPALGHKMRKVEEKKATCTESGNIEYYTCETCGKDFRYADGTEELTAVTTRATGHVFNGEYVCENEKTHTVYCTVCGAKGESTEHQWNAEKASILHDKHCEDCGYVAEPVKEAAKPEPQPQPEPEVQPQPEVQTEPEVQPALPEEPSFEPEATEPEIVAPEASEPETTEPEIIAPEASEPETTEPEIVEPEANEPEVIEPEQEETKPEEKVVPEIQPETVPETKEEAQPEEKEVPEIQKAVPEKKTEKTQPEKVETEEKAEVTEEKAEVPASKTEGSKMSAAGIEEEKDHAEMIAIIASSAAAVLVIGGAVAFVLKKRKN